MATIPGGMDFSQGRPVRLPPPPEDLPAEPLRLDCPARPEVIPGQSVRRGQCLLRPVHDSDSYHISPITGTVGELTPSGAGGYEMAIEPPGERVVTSLEAPAPRGRKLENWLEALRRVGPWADRDGGVGLIEQLNAARNHKVDTLICAGMDPFPPFPDRSSLLLSFPDDAALGTLILADLLGAERVVMQAARSPAMLGRLRSSCKRFRLRLVARHNRYPSADPTMVAYGRSAGGPRYLPHRHNPVERGLLMITPWTAIRIGRWFTLRRLDLLRPVLVAGPGEGGPLRGGYAMPGAPLGSVAADLGDALTEGDARVVAGDPMSGRAIHRPRTVPVDGTLVSVLPPHRPPAAEPCIECGWCVDVCPTRLDPIRTYRAARNRRRDAWLSDQLPWCIECGLCSYVCPSAIPLAQELGAVQHRMEA